MGMPESVGLGAVRLSSAVPRLKRKWFVWSNSFIRHLPEHARKRGGREARVPVMTEIRSDLRESTKSSRERGIRLRDRSVEDPSVFVARELVAAVRQERGLDESPVPTICVLDFDGDLTDRLALLGVAVRHPNWPCFHTGMWRWEAEGVACGIVPRTIGGPFAVLVAEQLAVCGARVVIGLASAGRVSPSLPIPAVVVADEAVRDEGTSYHYLRSSPTVAANPLLAGLLEQSVAQAGHLVVRGPVWTTDAPYRETAEQMDGYSASGVLAVEMQAASLFAFSVHSGLPVGLIAHVTNAPADEGRSFEKREDSDEQLLLAACRAAAEYLRMTDTR